MENNSIVNKGGSSKEGRGKAKPGEEGPLHMVNTEAGVDISTQKLSGDKSRSKDTGKSHVPPRAGNRRKGQWMPHDNPFKEGSITRWGARKRNAEGSLDNEGSKPQTGLQKTKKRKLENEVSLKSIEQDKVKLNFRTQERASKLPVTGHQIQHYASPTTALRIQAKKDQGSVGKTLTRNAHKHRP